MFRLCHVLNYYSTILPVAELEIKITQSLRVTAENGKEL